jgi:hypothetical protein
MKEKVMLELHVRRILFQKVKFITCDEELSDRGKYSIAMSVMNAMKVPVKNRDEWWKVHHRFVYSALVQKRSNVNLDMKKVFVGRFVFCFVVTYHVLKLK